LTFISDAAIIYSMKQYSKRPWTMNERNLLRKHYYVSSQDELLKLFPDRTMNSITKQVNYLKKRGWSFFKREI
jgi:hypothetical protein